MPENEENHGEPANDSTPAAEAVAPTSVSERDDEHPLAELQRVVGKRVARLAEMKSFDGELARRELRNEVYPILTDLIGFVAELSEHVEGDGFGIPADVGATIVAALARAAQAVQLASKVGTLTGDETRALAEHKAWFGIHAEALVAKVRDLIVEESA